MGLRLGEREGAEMGDEPRFLRPNVIIEPLVDKFYAALHTVAPVQAAMNLAFLQVPLLESYLQSPLVHINASRNPELRGAFFVNIDESRCDEVRALVSSMKRDRVELLRFAEAVAEAEEIVRQGATGFDLTPLYPRLPAALSGLVELAYDTNNQPSMRYIEPLLYQSDAHAEGRQSVQLSLETANRAPVRHEHTATVLAGGTGAADSVPTSRSGGAIQGQGAGHDGRPAPRSPGTRR